MFRLLCVTAHPDDEAGSFGGTLLSYAERGVDTYVVCLTEGQAASHRGDAASGEELGAIRRREFAASCEMLRVREAEVLNFPDKQLDRLDFYSATAELTRRMRIIRPHVVMTFGPEGALTAHPDHGMASVFTATAFQWAGRTNRCPEQIVEGVQPWRPQKLYFATATFTLPERPPVALAPVTAVINVARHVRTKIDAFHQHKTQTPLFSLFEATVAQRGDEELFHLVAACRPMRVEIETDLFAGVVDK